MSLLVELGLDLVLKEQFGRQFDPSGDSEADPDAKAAKFG